MYIVGVRVFVIRSLECLCFSHYGVMRLQNLAGPTTLLDSRCMYVQKYVR